MFSLTKNPIDSDRLTLELENQKAGAQVIFSGLVRDNNQGLEVESLEYQVYEEMALIEGSTIISEALDKFNIINAIAVHRYGHLSLKDCAIWIGVSAKHRDDAYRANRFIIDQIKLRLPIWKKEHYTTQEPQWVFCKDHHTHVHLCEKDYFKYADKLYNREKIKNKKVAIIGMGGLGCPVAQDLAVSGVSELTLFDGDCVDSSNLHRQFLYDQNDLGESKVEVASRKLEIMAPKLKVHAHSQFITQENISALLFDFDFIIDCTDNLKTKYILHNYIFHTKKTLFSSGIHSQSAMLRTFVGGMSGCLKCQGVDTSNIDVLGGTCDDNPVFSAHVNSTGHLLAHEVMMYLINSQNQSTKLTLYIDFNSFELNKIENIKDPSCTLCSDYNEYIFKNDFSLSLSQAQSKNIKIIDIMNKDDIEIFNEITDFNSTIALKCKNEQRSYILAKAMSPSFEFNIYSIKAH